MIKHGKSCSSEWIEAHRQAVPDKASIIRFEVIVRGTKSNCCHTNKKQCPTAKLSLHTFLGIHTQEIVRMKDDNVRG